MQFRYELKAWVTHFAELEVIRSMKWHRIAVVVFGTVYHISLVLAAKPSCNGETCFLHGGESSGF